jgi:hypothetical protein
MKPENKKKMKKIFNLSVAVVFFLTALSSASSERDKDLINKNNLNEIAVANIAIPDESINEIVNSGQASKENVALINECESHYNIISGISY